MSSKSKTDTLWKTLSKQHESMPNQSIQTLFDTDDQRFDHYHLSLDGLLYDYSKTHITADIKNTLIDLAKAIDLESKRDALFSGKTLNRSENRAALHTALRAEKHQDIEIDGENISDFVEDTKNKIKSISETIRFENKFKNIVHIGIGGSDLGPQMVCDALKNEADGPNIHFLSNIDGDQIERLLAGLDPASTLFIIASKTFSTLETTTNAQAAMGWIMNKLGEKALPDHFIAITANKDGAKDMLNLGDNKILPLRDWIGGRYSVWSAIGLPIAIALGYDAFEELLNGAHHMDEHFLNSPFEENLPVMLALVGLWHRNICDYPALAILPYAQDLERFPRYIQQLDMESNGKSCDLEGHPLDYKTAPIVFGEPGTNSQHAFFQSLHQGTDIIPCDFIVVAKPGHNYDAHHKHLVANALGQSAALMKGETNEAEPHKNFEGNRPSNTIILPALTPYYLGMLMALYEHKIFVQGAIWHINSFDQWGVELGKKIARDLSHHFDDHNDKTTLDSSTSGLLKHIKQHL